MNWDKLLATVIYGLTFGAAGAVAYLVVSVIILVVAMKTGGIPIL